MTEFEALSSADDIEQGDVIEWASVARSRPWKTFGVVVTADCDLYRGKHRGVISYVPAWTGADFFWYYWREPHLRDIKAKISNECLTKINRVRSDQDGNGLSMEALHSWSERAEPDEIATELCRHCPEKKSGILMALRRLEVIKSEELVCDHNSDRFIQNFNSNFDKNFDISKAFQKLCGSLPGDIFHLPSMPFEENGDLFLMLRHIRQIDAASVTARPDDIRTGQACVKRIAKVSAPYRYAITQNMARVFTDIGLPEEYDARRKTAAVRVLGELSQ